MIQRYQRGLVVGKFCPLHCGHELLIKHALDCCNEVIVISYTKPEFDSCDREVRGAWLTALFPQVTQLVINDATLEHLLRLQGIFDLQAIPHNDAPDQVHREFVGWLCKTVLRKTVNAVFTSEEYGDGFAATLTECFRAQEPSALPVAHISVDQKRLIVPVSGSQVRANPHTHRHFLSPQVYANFVKRICILGGESSGKSTLANALAERLQTVWAAEYGRELWLEKNGQLQFEDMLKIGLKQLLRERLLCRSAHTWLVCDTSALTTLFYSLHLFGAADPLLEQMAGEKYDRVFLCNPDFPFVQDGTRRDDSFRMRQHQWYVEQLTQRNIKFTAVHASVSERVDQIISSLSE
jgi:HTH-type transcriptional repressor of NAD biosynthesis genes